MRRGGALLLAGLLLAASGAGLWAWRDARAARRAERREALFAYLHGPLADLLEAESDAHALLLRSRSRKLKPAEIRALEAAAVRAEQASVAASQPAAPWAVDAFFAPLQGGLRWHAELAELARDWPRVGARRDLLAAALDADKGLRRSLAGALARQKEDAADALGLSKADVLEMNALVYTLKEEPAL